MIGSVTKSIDILFSKTIMKEKNLKSSVDMKKGLNRRRKDVKAKKT